MNILLISSDSKTACLCRKFLAEGRGGHLFLESVEGVSIGLERLAAGGIDVLLLELPALDGSGQDTLLRLRAEAPHIPIVLLVLQGDDELDAQAVSLGAQEYLTRDELTGRTLLHSVRRAMERKRAEEELRQTQDSYSRLIELSPDAMYIHKEGKVVFANRACALLYGASSAEELFGKQVLDIVHPDFRETLKHRLRTLYDDQKPVPRNEHKLRRFDGIESWVEVVANPVIYHGGSAARVIFRDISERKHAEEKLRQSEAILAAAQHIARLGSWDLDLAHPEDVEANQVRWSDEIFRILGYEPGQIEPSPSNFFRAIHPDDRDRGRKVVATAIQERRPYSFDSRIVLPGGVVRIVHSQGEFVCDERTKQPLRILGTLQDITERSEMEAALRRSEANFRSLVENSPYGILRITLDDKILQVNPALVGMLGYESEREVLNLNMATDVHCYHEHGPLDEIKDQSLNEESTKAVEAEWKRKDGTAITVRYGRRAVKDHSGRVDYYDFVVENITERRTLENQLRQAQKMEAVGQLAGGIAHDFNNLLGVILGYSELLLDELQEKDPLRKYTEQIERAGKGATSLTRQLLAFSRQQVLETRVLDLNIVVLEVEKMLRRVIGEDIELHTSVDPILGHVKADPGQIEQVLMNLAVNARDAMPDGGKLIIETSNIDVNEEYALRRPPMVPGRYVMLAMTDSGIGMDTQTQAHIFEPFFTTKEQGKGTGLGLATVYGFVKQSDGYIWVYSEPGLGSTFKIYLPRVDEAVPQIRLGDVATVFPRGSETILLVEDEQSLRILTRTLLEQSGYTVLEADGGNQAMEIARQHLEAIHVLLTDMVMPGMNGRAVAENVASIHPETRVVYMSGYTGFAYRGLLDSDAILLSKPFSRDALLHKLRGALLPEKTTI